MGKFIIFIIAAVAFWLYASYMFEDTFVDDPQPTSALEDTSPAGQ